MHAVIFLGPFRGWEISPTGKMYFHSSNPHKQENKNYKSAANQKISQKIPSPG